MLTVQTDPASAGIKNTRALEQNSPQATLLQTGLFARLGQLGIDYNKQVKPLFGNPIAFGVLSARSSASQTQFLAAWVTRSQSALAALVKKLGPALKSSGMHDGAKLYAVGGETLAIDGPTVLITRSPLDIDAALDRHKHGRGISSSQYARLTAGLGGGSLMQMFGDLTQALSVPGAAKARRVPWVAAIKGYGASISATQRAMTIRFHLDTTGQPLSSSQLPLAAGSAAPAVAGGAPRDGASQSDSVDPVPRGHRAGHRTGSVYEVHQTRGDARAPYGLRPEHVRRDADRHSRHIERYEDNDRPRRRQRSRVGHRHAQEARRGPVARVLQGHANPAARRRSLRCP